MPQVSKRTIARLIAGLLPLAVLGLASTYVNGAPVQTPDNEMVTVPAGSFEMGCNLAVDPLCFAITDEDQHSVHLDEFQIDKYEVTFRRFQKCVDAEICLPPAIGGGMNYDRFLNNEEVAKFPANGVTWEEANKFCKFEGRRLPTEAEWEKTARGIDGRIYPWGNEHPTCEVTVMDGSLAGELGCKTGNTFDVGSKHEGASPYGAMDMAGNLWEWVADWHDDEYYQVSPENNPKGPTTGIYKVARGGDFFSRKGYELRSSSRFFYEPSDYSIAVGFRCAK